MILTGFMSGIASVAGSAVALAYIERIETFCLGLDIASERGVLR